MLESSDVYATVAVKDLEAAKAFYGQKLGLVMVREDSEGAYFESGTSKIFVYVSQFAGTNQATSATWEVDDVEALVDLLKVQGVVFEQYDTIPGATRNGDVHTIGTEKAAWFKDPSGNILALVSR